jgi:hypothetical protein
MRGILDFDGMTMSPARSDERRNNAGASDRIILFSSGTPYHNLFFSVPSCCNTVITYAVTADQLLANSWCHHTAIPPACQDGNHRLHHDGQHDPIQAITWKTWYLQARMTTTCCIYRFWMTCSVAQPVMLDTHRGITFLQ